MPSTVPFKRIHGHFITFWPRVTKKEGSLLSCPQITKLKPDQFLTTFTVLVITWPFALSFSVAV